MQPRVLTLLVPALIALAACGPRARSAEPAARKRVSGGPPVASSFDVQLGSAVTFALHVTNNASKRLELTFPSGLTHDIVVMDTVGREVWRWSQGRMFTQTLRNTLLSGGETLDLDETWKDASLPPGRYTARAELTSVNYPLVKETPFTVTGTTIASR